TQVVPHIPVIWVDTGYLPAETYRFAEELTERLHLNLKIYQSPLTPARMEAL
ncbi:MAG TPA: phosphoadenosine phosphosulfate reductase, partial [Cyanothece sp. UBA12306]|nr:phosphoadenosine phosphosulfate reductase [Cyanothece sp. UBA12306]